MAGSRGMLFLAPLRLVPIDDAFLPYIEESDQNQQDVNQHLPEAEKLRTADFRQITINDRPRIKKDRLNIEQNKEHGHHVELYVEAPLGVSGGHYAAFVRRVLSGRPLVLAQQMGEQDHDSGKGRSHDKLEQQRYVANEVVVVRHDETCI